MAQCRRDRVRLLHGEMRVIPEPRGIDDVFDDAKSTDWSEASSTVTTMTTAWTNYVATGAASRGAANIQRLLHDRVVTLVGHME